MPLSYEQLFKQNEEVNNFLQNSFNFTKDNLFLDIILNKQEVTIDNIKLQLIDDLKDYIIELIYIDKSGNLVKENNNNEKITIIESQYSIFNIFQIQPLVILKKTQNISIGHLFRTKRTKKNIIIEYLGQKEFPLLFKTKIGVNNLNEKELNDLESNINITQKSEFYMKLLFSQSGICSLFIDDKNEKNIPININDFNNFKKFIEKNFNYNHNLNIEIDKDEKILSSYIVNEKTNEKKYIEIEPDLINSFERVIQLASLVYKQNFQNDFISIKKEINNNKQSTKIIKKNANSINLN